MLKKDSLMKIKDSYVKIKLENTPKTDLSEVRALIERMAGKKYAEVIVLEPCEDDGFDFYEVSDKDGKIVIRSATGVGFASGFNAYLKERCGYSVGMLCTSGKLPEVPPMTGEPLKRKSRFLYRYFFNYCTFSYTYAFDEWSDWQKTLDYLLLSGYNVILNPVGNESVWRKTLLSLGYTEKEADDFLCGPVFYAFEWMMNLTGFAGGVPARWYEERKTLAGKINRRLHAFGAMTAKPGYAGMVPADFGVHYPSAKIIEQGKWNGFVRPAILEADDPLFDKVAKAYYAASREIEGSENTHFYSIDPFHEGGKSEGIDLFAFSKKVYEKIAEDDKNAVWMLQGWTKNPKEELVCAIPDGHALVVNLLSETNAGPGLFAGAPWCFCAVCCFGGQYNFQGDAETLLTGPHRCLSDENTNLVGIGYMPEGANCVEFIYEVLSYNAFAKSGDLDEFIRYYLTTRYGVYNEKLAGAWKRFCREVLNGKQLISGESALCARPSLTVQNTSRWGSKPNPDVDQSVLLEYIDVLLSEYDALKDNPAYKKDLMEAARQAVSNLSWHYAHEIQAAYAAKDLSAVSRNGAELLSLFDTQIAIVSTDADMMLGKWLNKARKLGRTPAEKTYFEWNARLLVTLWGDREGADTLRDYAAREWQGLLEDFYRPRWESFISRLELSLLTGKPLEPINSYDEELPFTYRKNSYPTEPVGNLKTAVAAALQKIRAAR